MKAALEAWGADSNLFHQGVAKESDDPEVVAAAMAKPGVILRRPVGSDGPFREQADLPKHLSEDEPDHRRKKARAKTRRPAPRPPTDDKTARKAARAFEKEEARREKERRKEEAAAAKRRERREEATAKAQAALDRAKREHHARSGAIEAERAALDRRSQGEEGRWERQKDKLEKALRRARD